MKTSHVRDWYIIPIEAERIEFPKENVVLYLRNPLDIILDAKECYMYEALNTKYFANICLADRTNYTNMEFWQIEAAIKAYIILKGEKAFNENAVIKFIKENTGISTEISIETAYKKHMYKYNEDAIYYSKPIIIDPITTEINL